MASEGRDESEDPFRVIFAVVSPLEVVPERVKGGVLGFSTSVRRSFPPLRVAVVEPVIREEDERVEELDPEVEEEEDDEDVTRRFSNTCASNSSKSC